MDIYTRLIENPLFFKWIYHPNKEIEDYWKQYMALHKADADTILEFKEIISSHLTYTESPLTELEKKSLARGIVKQFEVEDAKTMRRRTLKRIVAYAATAVIFLVLGGITVLIYESHQISKSLLHGNSLNNIDTSNPVLVIDDTKQIQLTKGKTELNYSQDGGFSINNEKVVSNPCDNKQPSINTLIIPYGNHSKVTLADGTTVCLNAGSRFIYPSTFTGKFREVYLVGEGYFDVIENEKMPFIVRTSNVKVEVLGTSFDISAYSDDRFTYTVLEEGSVNITYKTPGLFNKNVRLSPGQLALFDIENKKNSIYKVNVDHYISWTGGIIQFNNSDFNRLLKKLERYFNIKFQYSDPLIGALKITGKLDVTKGKDEVVEYLSLLTGMQVVMLNESTYIIQ